MEYLTILCPRCGRLHEVPAEFVYRYRALKCPVSLRSYPTSRARVICRRVTL